MPEQNRGPWGPGMNSFAISNGATLDQHLASGETFGSTFIKDAIARGRGFETAFGDLRQRDTADIDNTGGEQHRVGAAANASVQSKFQTVRGRNAYANNLEQTIRRGKARQSIVNRGDSAIKNQQLKDRMTAMSKTVNRRGQVNQTIENAGRLRSGLDTAVSAANSQVSAAKWGAAGAVVGGAVRGFGDMFGGGGEVPVGQDQGTAAADWYNMQDTGGGFDIGNIGNSGGIMYG